MAEARIDKWLWSVRIFKTRTIASDACKKGRITVNGVQVKPSKMVHEGDTVQVRKPPVTYSFRVLQCIENRVGAKLVPDMMQNITPQDQYDLLEMNRIGGFVKRAAGLGRPTKKTAATWRISCPTPPLTFPKSLILMNEQLGSGPNCTHQPVPPACRQDCVQTNHKSRACAQAVTHLGATGIGGAADCPCHPYGFGKKVRCVAVLENARHFQSRFLIRSTLG